MLVVKNLKVNYGKIEAIKDVSFEVPDGKIVTLIGANGAGKTTTLRALSGLEKTSGGSIVLDGMDITNREAHKMVPLGISHVPEGRKIFPTLTVRENLELAGWTIKDKKLVRERIEEVFELFPRIKERASQLGGTLSGGEQQMLAVGRGIVTGGKILLLDEPSMGLAPVLVDEIFSQILAINKKGTTILLVEQNAAEALDIADFAYVLEVGYTTLHGPAKEIAKDPRVREAYLGV
ncbi:High-affinity branched-chain amino acid transport ATP-binding protein LivF [bioreactor metagenome]|jgi:branched-chain amino acid transport system ATP-binding protein|uniref:Leucine/isoleucine/valine transporter subunit ATP-binding component of ABC superfamily n=2 Tax=root TaxID=1 RepID=A0A652ZS17_9SPIR|nr:ABC transporter ATP-binding protein [Spirochaetales bacterium]NLX46475.1 ABC transporter ATP-binding protein [Treponema sp.]VBB38580.1 leucine/isoleucine/valine transporter subunit; ATP-binding component of ABC superfamily [uncultured Spirochaetota bacterium]HOI21758.1 ABC transporter ATP-binding protein [Spirochaetales bacterium]